jgi:diacylglycerol O-acyltransferase / wax synthase
MTEPLGTFAAAPRDGGGLERLRPVDLAWLRMDEPANLMMISGVLTFATPLPLERLRAVLEARLLPIPRFRQRVVGSYDSGRLFWEEVASFDFAHHLVPERLPGAGGDAELSALVSELMSRPLARDRPLWCFHLVENYQGGSAVIGRLHHVIGDGIALVLVLLSLADRDPIWPLEDPSGSAHVNPFSLLFSRAPGVIESVRRHAEELMPEGMKLLLSPADAASAANPVLKALATVGAAGVLTFRPADPGSDFRGTLGVPKRAAWSRPLPVEEIRALAQRAGGSLNDVLLSTLAGGLGRYLARRGRKGEELVFRAAVPVNLRPLERMGDLGNHFGLIFLGLPVGLKDPLARLTALRKRLRALKTSAEPLAAFRILQLLGWLPAALQRLVVRIIATKATAVMTSVPGPREALYLAGQAIGSIFFWVPQAGRVSLGISILSYAGQVRLGLASDAGLVPDPEAIIDCFYEELESLRERVG